MNTDNNDIPYLHLIVKLALEKKATDPVILDLTAMGAFTGYFVVLTASSSRAVYAIMEDIKSYLKEHFSMAPQAIDGIQESTWALMDYGSFFVHIFQDGTRKHYELEKVWGKARPIEYDESIAEGLMAFVTSEGDSKS